MYVKPHEGEHKNLFQSHDLFHLNNKLTCKSHINGSLLKDGVRMVMFF